MCWAASLLNPRVCDDVAPILQPDDFYAEAHRKLYGHMVSMHNEGQGIDTVLLWERLKQAGELEAIGGTAYMMEVSQSVPVAAHALHYAKIVRDKAKLRDLIDASTDILRGAYDPTIDIGQLVAQAQQRLQGLESTNGKPLDESDAGTRQFKLYTMAELDAVELSVDMVVDGALMTGAVAVDGGTFKVLKTSLALEQGLSMAIGPTTKYLDHFAVHRKASCVYFAGEGGLVPLRDTLRRQCEHKGVRLRDVNGFLLCDEVPRLDSDADMEKVVEILKDRKAEFATFDPCYLMMGQQAALAGNVYAMGAMLGRMLRACREAGATPKILHHFNRAKGSAINDAPDLADLSQAGMAEIAGQWALLGRTKPFNPEYPGEHDLVLSIGSRMGFCSKWAVHISEGSPDDAGGRYWQPEVTAYSEAREQEKEKQAAARELAAQEKAAQELESDRKKVVDATRQWGKPAESKDIEPRVNIKTARFCRAWASLVDDGALRPIGTVKKGNGRSYPTFGIATENGETTPKETGMEIFHQ